MSKKKKREYKVDSKGKYYVNHYKTSLDNYEKEYTEKVYAPDWSLSGLTYTVPCNGMARRILNDLEGLTHSQLKTAAYNDERYGGNDYQDIIKLGELLKSLKEY
ncbi:MAG TPA: hypothetical protein GXX63_02110 [Tissierellia bacterium]|nr:hypothetical protein [Tissierellia bacterium]